MFEKSIARVVLEQTPRRMSIDGRVVRLTKVEYALLSRLSNAAGAVLPREQLFVDVFERLFDPEDRSLDVHIYRLRKKLGPYGWLLVTVRGSGHMLRSPLDTANLHKSLPSPIRPREMGLV